MKFKFKLCYPFFPGFDHKTMLQLDLKNRPIISLDYQIFANMQGRRPLEFHLCLSDFGNKKS